MKFFKHLLFSCILPVVAMLIVIFGCNPSSNKNMQICDQQYALCTSAICVPQPGDATKAICVCDVQEGKSMSTALCNTLQPSTDENGIRTLYSTFSLQQFNQGKKGMKCPSGTPWTWCLNKRCTVDPSNSKKAICLCDVVRTGEWITLGGNCDTSTCATGYWSGATLKDYKESGLFMTKALGLDASPVKWCQAAVP
jgi:hypothetical protein